MKFYLHNESRRLAGKPGPFFPSTDQIFLNILVRGDQFSWNFGPPDQNFRRTKISVTDLLPHTLTPSHPSHKHTHTAVLPAIPPVPSSPLGPLPLLPPARSGRGTPLVTRRVEETSPCVTAHPATAAMEVLVIHELSTFKLCNLSLRNYLVSQATPFAERGRVWSRCNYRVVAEERNYRPLRLGNKL